MRVLGCVEVLVLLCFVFNVWDNIHGELGAWQVRRAMRGFPCDATCTEAVMLVLFFAVVVVQSHVFSPERPGYSVRVHAAGLAWRLRCCCLTTGRASTREAHACAGRALFCRRGEPPGWQVVALAEARQLLCLSW